MTIHIKSIKQYYTITFFCLASCFAYYVFAYHTIRTQLWVVVGLYSILFALYLGMLNTKHHDFKVLVIVAFLMRLVFMVATPNLSQDFYRFIWDGRMILEGFNPYLYTPQSFIENSNFPVVQAQELYDGMGMLNASHYTNYPPLKQLCFVLANLMPEQLLINSLMGLRIIIIAADIGIIFFGKKLLITLKLPIKNLWWYALNPFIIIELTGNLHFEGVMLFFFIWSLYLLQNGHWKWSAVVFSCAVLIKLIPLMFLPLFFWWFVSQKSGSIKNNSLDIRPTFQNFFKAGLTSKLLRLIQFYGIVIGVTLILFLPFLSKDLVVNFSKTVGLWFTNFEFNASIYYVIREIGYLVAGYNIIATLGKILPFISVVIILYFSFFKRNNSLIPLVSSMLLTYACYLFLSTTVHPWYLSTLVLLSVFSRYIFPLVWSFVVILSYFSYISVGNAEKSENLWIIALEYSIVFSVFVWEVFMQNSKKTSLFNSQTHEFNSLVQNQKNRLK